MSRSSVRLRSEPGQDQQSGQQGQAGHGQQHPQQGPAGADGVSRLHHERAAARREPPACQLVAIAGQPITPGKLPGVGACALRHLPVRRPARKHAEAGPGQRARAHDDGGIHGTRAGQPQVRIRRVGETHGGEPPDDGQRDRRQRLRRKRPSRHDRRTHDEHARRREPAVQGGRNRADRQQRREARHQSEGGCYPTPHRTAHLMDSRTPDEAKNNDLDETLTRRPATLTRP